MKKFFLISSLALTSATLATGAVIATDNASNYGGGWNDGSNGGSGFLAWTLSNNDNGGTLFAGSGLGDSTAGAGNINTGGVSFTLYAHPSFSYVNADRAFALALDTGKIFSFQLALNNDNGNKGFNLFAGTQGQVLNFNVDLGGSVSAASGASLNPGSGAGYSNGGNAVLNVTIAVTSPTQFSYDITRTAGTNQGTLFSGNVSGLTDPLSGFGFYVAGTDAGAPQNNLYINNLNVIPEPSAVALLGFGALFLGTISSRNRVRAGVKNS